MQFVRKIFKSKNSAALVLLLATTGAAVAQENSPYSRYGLGNLVPAQHAQSRGMGGVSAAFADGQAINFMNPASYSKLRIMTFDVSLDYENRKIRNPNTADRFSANNMLINYIQVGMPLNKKGWGLNFGLKPVSRINYSIESRSRLAGIDSIQTLFEGQGGTYQAFAGTGISWKNLSVGINGGYFFGTKEYSTKVNFVNDSVFYNNSKSTSEAHFGSVFANVGIQYSLKLSKTSWLKFGAFGNMDQTLKGSKKVTRATYAHSATGAESIIDSVYTSPDQKGEVIYPASFTAGLIFERTDKFLIGADFESNQWSQYRFFNEQDKVQDNWTLRFGAQLLPNYKSKNYWANVLYRVGFYTGPDYIHPESISMPNKGFTFGMGLPIKADKYTNQFTVINTNFELGFRGNNKNIIKESMFRISLGLSLSDIWFYKRVYN